MQSEAGRGGSNVITPRVENGNLVPSGSYPSVLMFTYDTPTESWSLHNCQHSSRPRLAIAGCTATLIGDGVALTAAHCVDDSRDRKLNILHTCVPADEESESESGYEDRYYRVIDTITLEDAIDGFGLDEGDPQIDDIAILVLDRRTPDLPHHDVLNSEDINVGDNFTFYGYGHAFEDEERNDDGFYDSFGYKRMGTATVSNVIIRPPNTRKAIRWTGDRNSHTQGGDSGGPVFFIRQTSTGLKEYIGGVISVGAVTSTGVQLSAASTFPYWYALWIYNEIERIENSERISTRGWPDTFEACVDLNYTQGARAADEFRGCYSLDHVPANKDACKSLLSNSSLAIGDISGRKLSSLCGDLFSIQESSAILTSDNNFIACMERELDDNTDRFSMCYNNAQNKPTSVDHCEDILSEAINGSRTRSRICSAAMP